MLRTVIIMINGVFVGLLLAQDCVFVIYCRSDSSD